MRALPFKEKSEDIMIMIKPPTIRNMKLEPIHQILSALQTIEKYKGDAYIEEDDIGLSLEEIKKAVTIMLLEQHRS